MARTSGIIPASAASGCPMSKATWSRIWRSASVIARAACSTTSTAGSRPVISRSIQTRLSPLRVGEAEGVTAIGRSLPPGATVTKTMADLRRFSLFARFLAERFDARRVFDVAGGMGKLNEALTALGHQVSTFDRRHRHLSVTYAQRTFT